MIYFFFYCNRCNEIVIVSFEINIIYIFNDKYVVNSK